MALPTLTPEQRADALAKAQQANQARAAARQALKDGTRTLTEVLADEALARVKVLAVLTALPGVGDVTAKALMDRIGIAAARRTGALTGRQRDALLAELAPVPV